MTVSGKSVLDAIATSLLDAGRYNSDDKTGPVAVLWPDPERHWEPIVTKLGGILRIAALGDFDESKSTGPAIWIRLLLANSNQSSEVPLVVYLPGVSRGDLRAVESSSAALRPLAELQFRSAWWLQSNQSPWTPGAFLRSPDGLKLDVARDDETTKNLALVLSELSDSAVDDLRNVGRLDASFFSSLLVADETKALLSWLNEPEATKLALSGNEWAAFVSRSKSTFGVDPGAVGALTIAAKLGQRQGPWKKAWDRFAEAPHSYPKIPDQLRRAKPSDRLFSDLPDSWPQDNEEAEREVEAALVATGGGTPAEARSRVLALEREHAKRRLTVWAVLGAAPLAVALQHLSIVAGKTRSHPNADNPAGYASWYADEGWQVDAAAVAALASVTDQYSRGAVGDALRAIYLPWLDEVARKFQHAVTQHGQLADVGLDLEKGDCVVFVDGLRYDVAESVRRALAERGANADIRTRFAAFPTMTSSGKPAVAPFDQGLTGGNELAPSADGRPVDAGVLRSLLGQAAVQVLGRDELGNPQGFGWTETGDLDATGHKLELKLVDRIPQEVADIASRVRQLLDGGWGRVHIVTDHGWLLMPGQLPKMELPQHLTVVRKSRCARLSDGAGAVDQPTFPWTWDSGVRIAIPHGIAAFQAGCIYEHGGVSPQESITPHIIVSRTAAKSPARIEGIKWLGLRCRVDYVDAPIGAVLDVRRSPGDSSSSVTTAKVISGSGEDRVLVPDDSIEGSMVFVVLLSEQGEILAQVSTRVGE
ncbi:BREX-1 system phosphatase PglZ type B [Arthrobacter globiformis]|uniref:BREX-1 system phosphatase PglZ type B n=1 Tax=Arthrobacter globiformis TaxID=1665 RepID=UPI00278ACA4B|nr:BREX-1 system phosphatase PglZ type B [Arthrobacter globiformis]MDQ0863778.1 hypothetical protein [Arthrobacter globiformis]